MHACPHELMPASACQTPRRGRAGPDRIHPSHPPRRRRGTSRLAGTQLKGPGAGGPGDKRTHSAAGDQWGEADPCGRIRAPQRRRPRRPAGRPPRAGTGASPGPRASSAPRGRGQKQHRNRRLQRPPIGIGPLGGARRGGCVGPWGALLAAALSVRPFLVRGRHRPAGGGGGGRVS